MSMHTKRVRNLYAAREQLDRAIQALSASGGSPNSPAWSEAFEALDSVEFQVALTKDSMRGEEEK